MPDDDRGDTDRRESLKEAARMMAENFTEEGPEISPAERRKQIREALRKTNKNSG